MMNHQEMIKQLYGARMLSTESDFELFDDALAQLDGAITVDDVYDICKVFHDGTNDDEVMFGMVHLIEQLSGNDYLKCIARFTPNMNEAPEWAMLLNIRILNSQQDFNEYITIIRNLDVHSKDKILSLLKAIKNDNPQKFGEKVDLIFNSSN